MTPLTHLPTKAKLQTKTDTKRITNMHITELPAVGQPLQTGIFAGLTTTRDGSHCAVILLDDKPATALTWNDAMKWATGINASLPTRPVAALLYASLRDQFEPRWHWTSEEFTSSSAWYQVCVLGSQGYSSKSFEGRARAVRLIQITA